MNSKKKKLFMIGNAHIDPVWLWQWQEGFHETKATFRSALDRMEEFPDFIFVASSAAIYQWVEHSDPEMFAEIRQRIIEGRWKVVGGWWIEPDCNLPGGESFVRQGLFGQRYFKEKFGVTTRVGYTIDSFGHNGMLPQILKKSGMPYYVFMRPAMHEKGLPGRLFWWESDDGSRVLAFRIALAYGTWGDNLARHVANVAEIGRASCRERCCGTERSAERTDVLLRRWQPRRRTHQRKPGKHPAAAPGPRYARAGAQLAGGIFPIGG
jgi:alpha-mannosidase